MVNAPAGVEQIRSPTRSEDELLALARKVERACERVTEMTERVKDRAIEKRARFVDYTHAHPVKSVLSAAGIGVGLGFVLGAVFARRHA